jgi:NAD+ kinase
VKALKKQTYVIDKRTMIHLDASISMFGNVPFALNEFSIHKRDTAPMIKIHTYLNGEFLNTYWADGLIVATPLLYGLFIKLQRPIMFPDRKLFNNAGGAA